MLLDVAADEFVAGVVIVTDRNRRDMNTFLYRNHAKYKHPFSPKSNQRTRNPRDDYGIGMDRHCLDAKTGKETKTQA